MSVLFMWTIYERPLDYPRSFVARRWVVKPDGVVAAEDRVLVSDELEWLRDQMEDMGLYCIPRSESDEPQIVETWI